MFEINVKWWSDVFTVISSPSFMSFGLFTIEPSSRIRCLIAFSLSRFSASRIACSTTRSSFTRESNEMLIGLIAF